MTGLRRHRETFSPTRMPNPNRSPYHRGNERSGMTVKGGFQSIGRRLPHFLIDLNMLHRLWVCSQDVEESTYWSIFKINIGRFLDATAKRAYIPPVKRSLVFLEDWIIADRVVKTARWRKVRTPQDKVLANGQAG